MLRGDRGRAEPSLRLRDLRQGPVQPVRAGGRAAGGGDAGAVVQPAVHLRRGRPGQDPPPARHRPLRRPELQRLPDPLRVDRDVPQRVRRRHPHQRDRASSSAATGRSTSCSSTTSSSWRARKASRRSSSTPSTRCTAPTSRSSSRRIACPTTSPLSRIGCGVGSSGASSRTSNHRTSRPAWPSSATRPSVTTAAVPADVARVHRHAHHEQHPRARGRADPGHGLRQPQPRPRITVPLAEQLLADLLHGRRSGPSRRRAIIEAVAAYFRQPVERLRGKSRQRPLVLARQIAMYVMRDLTDLSYPAIAREFGGRDHTTVIHAVEQGREADEGAPAGLRPGHAPHQPAQERQRERRRRRWGAGRGDDTATASWGRPRSSTGATRLVATGPAWWTSSAAVDAPSTA